ncbi:MAG: glycosyltransferase family 2 protein [Lachnospiraceae bacterium]|nr:glycosyltransferase family 2 protein [Lachnospiraceae bacterium]
MITISVCMIVKNEEAVLARALDCLQGIADEIVIVDTGSTDRTKEIAARYTDRIFDFVWVDDFAAARNFAFSKATKEYIYSADADEVIEPAEQEKFRRLKQVLDPRIEIVQMFYTNQLQFGTTYNFDEELRPKLYRRLREFVWEEPVHEAVRLNPVIYDSDIRIKHMPLSNHAGRDFAVFRKEIARKGTLSEKLTGMYARELFMAGAAEDFAEAVSFFQAKAEECKDESMLKKCQCVLVRAAVQTGNTNLLLQNAMKQAVMGQPSSEVCFDLGEYFLQAGDIYEAILWYYNALYETEPEISLAAGGADPAKRLAECYRKLGDTVQQEHYEKVMKEVSAHDYLGKCDECSKAVPDDSSMGK